ncbi:hypothetical protein RB195_006456 [Necator americanus]|uniref:Uncharacterized protein n=1 Tax=Necator americanus TaxID=51031 RepID=A0ABR1BU71_NECAM
MRLIRYKYLALIWLYAIQKPLQESVMASEKVSSSCAPTETAEDYHNDTFYDEPNTLIFTIFSQHAVIVES